VKRAQLLGAGISRHTIDRKARTGDLHRVHRGIYLVGHRAQAPMAKEWAALLVCGDGALISHCSAAYMWSILPQGPSEVDVTLVGRRCRPKGGVRVHVTARIDPRDLRHKDRIPLTAPARTVIDLAADRDDATLRRALGEARVLQLVSDRELRAALDRAGSRRGVGLMRALLDSEVEQGYARSEAERRMLELVRAAGLPQPLPNARLEGYSVDLLWPAQRFVVEVDGYRYHGHRAAFERDRRKDARLLAAGYRVMRFTWRQLVHEPMLVAAMLASALTERRTPG
jgi:very-short-patch-repair endonuclease